jgi:hypothetical protein
MAIVIERWPSRVEIYAWDESVQNLEAHLDQEHRVSNLSFLDLFDAQAFLRDLTAADSDVLVRLREQTERLTYGDSSNKEAIIAQFAGLLANNHYRVRQYDFFRTAWPLPPPAPPAPPNPKPPPKRTDPPKPVENKAVLVEFVEVVDRGTEGVVTGPGEASTTLPTHVNRSDKNSGLYKQYVNIVDKDLEGQDKRHPEYGRYIEIKAKVTLDGKPKAGELVVFTFKVRRGDSCPALFTKDREGFGSSGGALTHVGTTDGEGWTETVKFYLSAYGGDYFELYAKGPDGKELRLGYYQVWRKFWYQITKAKSQTLPSLKQAESSYEQVYIEMVSANTVEFDKTTMPPGTFYPAWMAQWPPGSGGTEMIPVFSDHNKPSFFQLFKEESNKPVKAHLVICNSIWVPGDMGSYEMFVIDSNPSKVFDLHLDDTYGSGVLKPPIGGGPLVGWGRWQVLDEKGKETKIGGRLTDDNILIEQTDRKNFKQIRIVLPPEAPDPTVERVFVNFRVNFARCLGGQAMGKHILIEHSKNTSPNQFNNIVIHETGHGFNQTPLPNEQPKPLPDHPNRNIQDFSEDPGRHCITGASKKIMPDQETPLFTYTGGTCVMFRVSFNNLFFCPVCQPYIRLQNMERFL